jgi:hypothetical protein
MMAKSKSKTIVVFAGSDGGKGPQLLGKKSGATEVPIETLKDNLEKFVSSLNDLLPSMDPKLSPGVRLTSFEVSVGVNGKGEVGFLGTGVEVGAEASLTLKFER